MINRNIKGFTLIEIMIAVAILAIVAGIAVPVYQGYTESARATECANEVAAIRLAEEEFFLVNNSYFTGANTGELTGAKAGTVGSGGIYQASAAALSAASLCDYAVTAGAAGIGTQYTITATPKVGGALDGTGFKLVQSNF